MCLKVWNDSVWICEKCWWAFPIIYPRISLLGSTKGKKLTKPSSTKQQQQQFFNSQNLFCCLFSCAPSGPLDWFLSHGTTAVSTCQVFILSVFTEFMITISLLGSNTAQFGSWYIKVGISVHIIQWS